MDIVYCCFLGNYLKVYGPVIQYQCETYPDSYPILWIPKNKNYPQKAGTEISADQLKSLRRRLPNLIVSETGSIYDVVREHPVMAVISLAFSVPFKKEEYLFLKRKGIKLCSLGYMGEEIFYLLKNGLDVLDRWDVATTFSSFWIEGLSKLLDNPESEEKIREKLVPIGFVELDQVKMFSREKIRKKYRIPHDRKIVYFSTAPSFHTIMPFRYRYIDHIFRRGSQRLCNLTSRLTNLAFPRLEMDRIVSYKTILALLRDATQKYNFLVVSKTRKKHKDPDIVKSYSDYFFQDGLYYPFRTLELMYISDLYIGFPSASVIESVFLGKYSVTLSSIPVELYDRGIRFMFRNFYLYDFMWKISGVTDFFDLYKKGEFDRFFGFLDSIGSLGIDKMQRKRVVETILGFDDVGASGRFLEIVFDPHNAKIRKENQNVSQP